MLLCESMGFSFLHVKDCQYEDDESQSVTVRNFGQIITSHTHPGVAENIAPVGGPGSDVIVEGIPP